MGKLWAGIKAGTISGLAYGTISAIISHFALLSLRDMIVETMNSPMPQGFPLTADQLYQVLLSTAPMASVMVGAIGGLILGIVFSIGFQRIPGKTSFAKGMLFGSLLWLILAVPLGIYWFGVYDVTNLLFLVPLGPSLVFGVLLGYLYSRLGGLSTQ